MDALLWRRICPPPGTQSLYLLRTPRTILCAHHGLVLLSLGCSATATTTDPSYPCARATRMPVRMAAMFYARATRIPGTDAAYGATSSRRKTQTPSRMR
eukprot:3585699-Rhodomonas_salina.1